MIPKLIEKERNGGYNARQITYRVGYLKRREMSEARRYLVVERYEALTVGGKIHSLAKYFDEIETDYQEWEDLKNIQALLSPGNLKRMVVQLMAKAARTVQELDVTIELCDKYNPGPALLAEKRKNSMLNV